jgi:hypothetical protein
MQALVQAADGILLLGLVGLYGRRMGSAFRNVLRQPFLVYVILFGIIAVLALSTFANFGLLARQRAIVLPFLFILLAFAPSSASEEETPKQAAST